MKAKRGEIQVFSVSFLDVICCALGGTLMLLLATMRPETTSVDALDLVFVVDATGSMREELDGIKENIESAVAILTELSSKLRIGFVIYWDEKEIEVTRTFGLTEMDAEGRGIQSAKLFLASVQAGSSDKNTDFEESVDHGLAKAVALDWHGGTKNYIVLIGDAICLPGHEERCFSLVRQFASRNSHSIMSAIAATEDASTSSFFETLAVHGRGSFTKDQGKILDSILLAVIKADSEEITSR